MNATTSPASLGPGILERMVRAKREEVAGRRRGLPLERLRSSLSPSRHSLTAALRARAQRSQTAFILECKRCSPSRGVLRPDYDPAAIARGYAPLADAVSVLADRPFFGGSLDDVARVRAAIDLPVLLKDVVVDVYQVFDARRHGADAVLLMASVLDDRELRACRAAARDLGMDALIEVHDQAELRRVLALGADLVGINHRNLRTLEVDLETSERLAPSVPPATLLVAESGIRDRRDIRRLRPRVDAFLVGTALMSAPDPELAARELIFGRVKICGLCTADDARAAAAAGASYGGLVFASGSPRRIDEQQAQAIRAAAPKLRLVGVFVDERPARVAALAAGLRLEAVQLHGAETANAVGELRPLLPPGCAIWKAHRVRPGEDIGAAIRLAGDASANQPLASPPTTADRILLDSHVHGQDGGSGQRFDWGLLANLPERESTILAGGIDPENVALADGVGTWALDVSSGVEDTPGGKSAVKLAALFEALRSRPRRVGPDSLPSTDSADRPGGTGATS